MRVLKCLLRKSKKIYYFTFLTNFGAVRSSIPSLPVGSVWLGYRIDDPSASGQSIAKTADRRDHRYKIVGVMLFSSFNRGSNFLCVVCTAPVARWWTCLDAVERRNVTLTLPH